MCMLPGRYQTREQLPSIWMCNQWQWRHNCSYYYNVRVPPSQCENEQTSFWGMMMYCGSKRAWRWVLDCWQLRQDLAQVLMSLERPRQTNLEEIICWEASLPGCEILCKLKKKNIFPELFINNWAKNTHRNVNNQALSACLLKHNFEGWTAEQTLRFCAVILLSGHG